MTSSLLQLHAVFTHLDSISPSHPASGAITLPKLKEALSIYAQWTFPDDEEAGAQPAAGAVQEAAEELQRRRRRRRQEREQQVRDMIAAVDLNRNGKIELPEFIKLMEEQSGQQQRKQAAKAERRTTTRTGCRHREVLRPAPPLSVSRAVKPSLTLSASRLPRWSFPVLQNIRLVFDAFDKDRDGSELQQLRLSWLTRCLCSHPCCGRSALLCLSFISSEELKAALRSQGIDHLTAEEIQQMVSTAATQSAAHRPEPISSPLCCADADCGRQGCRQGRDVPRSLHSSHVR